MQVYELKLVVYTLADIPKEECSYEAAKLINTAMGQSEQMIKIHNEKKYKGYVFDQLYPISDQGIYKRDQIYTLRIRTISKKIAVYFEKNLANQATKQLKGIKIESRIIPKHMIEKVYSISPVILKNEEGYWKKLYSFSEFEKRLGINLIKKYNTFMGTKIKEDFPLYNIITIDNKKPIAVKYKNIRLLGDKLTIQVSDHPMAQEVFYMALGTGICENNAEGMGFLNYKFL